MNEVTFKSYVRGWDTGDDYVNVVVKAKVTRNKDDVPDEFKNRVSGHSVEIIEIRGDEQGCIIEPADEADWERLFDAALEAAR